MESSLAPRDGLAPVGLPAGPAVPPLNVTGLVVSRFDLVRALRFYVPQIVDLTPLDANRYLLSLNSATENGTANGGPHG